MARERKLEVANLIVRFGGEAALLDHLDDIVLPALTDEKSSREWGDTAYFLQRCGRADLPAGDGKTVFSCVYGRFIKTTKLEREQYFDPQKRRLVKSHKTLDTAPSAVFVVILDNHKVLYFHETSYAPTLTAFQATIREFIHKRHKIVNSRRGAANRIPRPTVEVVPLATAQSLDSFIGQFKLLKRVDIEVLDTNDELDYDDFFKGLREQKLLTGSRSTKLINENPKGLDKKEVAKQLTPAVQQANSRVKLTGTDSQDDKLAGSNETFRFFMQLAVDTDDLKSAAEYFVQKASSVVKSKMLKPSSWFKKKDARLEDAE